MISVEERFWTKVDIKHPNDCWEWKAFKGKDNYGWFHYKTGSETAHRVAYILTYGPIPQGLYVLHNCDNTRCVNPYHLKLGTQADNVKDMKDRNRFYNSNKTHCINGHEFTPENTIERRGQRECATCRKMGSFVRWEKEKERNNG